MTQITRRDMLHVLGAFTISASASAQIPAVCSNDRLIRTLRVLHRACTPLGCDFHELRVLDDSRYRDAILAALGNAELNPVHVFFPDNVSDVRRCFDWRRTKQSQLNTFQYLNRLSDATIYLIGRASRTGSDRHNRSLSAERMASVKAYLETMNIPCREFRGAWMGREILQFTESDAAYLRIPATDYRENRLVLNQAVHVFAIPCVNIGL